MEKPKTRLFDELMRVHTESEHPNRKELLVESCAVQVVAAVNNLRKLINETYTDEAEREEILKRLMSSIRSGSDTKIRRGVRDIMEGRND